MCLLSGHHVLFMSESEKMNNCGLPLNLMQDLCCSKRASDMSPSTIRCENIKIWTSIIQQENYPALMVSQTSSLLLPKSRWLWVDPQTSLPNNPDLLHSKAGGAHSSGSRTEGCRVDLLWAQPVGISLASQRHWLSTLREVATKGTADRFALPEGLWIISARIWVFIWALKRGMLTSPVSDTEEALFGERKPLCRLRAGLCVRLYTEGKHQRLVDEVRSG